MGKLMDCVPCISMSHFPSCATSMPPLLTPAFLMASSAALASLAVSHPICSIKGSSLNHKSPSTFSCIPSMISFSSTSRCHLRWNRFSFLLSPLFSSSIILPLQQLDVKYFLAPVMNMQRGCICSSTLPCESAVSKVSLCLSFTMEKRL